jgi:phage-related protein
VPVPVVVEFIAGTAGLSAGIGAMEAKMAGLKASSEASMANVAKLGIGLSAVVAAGAVAVAVEGVKMAGDFQQSVTKLETTAGELHGNIDMVSNSMLDMAGKFGISANDLAKGMYIIESSGLHGTDALYALGAAAEGAKQEGADLTHVADALSTVLHDYSIPADQAANVTSKLITAVSFGKTNFDEFTASLHSVTPRAAAAGISLADVTGSLSAITASGTSAQQAAENLGATIGSLSAPTQPMIKEMAALGLNAIDLSHNLGKNGVAGSLQEVATAIATKMGPEGTVLLSNLNQNSLAVTAMRNAFDTLSPSAQKVASAIDQGTMSFAEFRKTGGGLDVESKMQINQWNTLHDKAIGFSAALRTGANQSQNFMEAMKRATGTSEGLNVALQLTGEHASATNEAIKAIGESTAQADGNIKGWAEVQGNFNQKMSELKETIGSLVIRLGQALLPVLSSVADKLMAFISFAQDHQSVLVALAAVIGGALIVALSALSVALWTIATNPVVLIVAGIVAAVALLAVGIYELYTHWDTVWGGIKRIAADVADFFVMRWNQAWDSTKNALNSIGAFFTDRWNSFYGTIAGAMGKIHDAVVSAWSTVTGFLSDRWNSAWASLQSGLSTVGAFFAGVWNDVLSITTTVLNAISGFFSKWWPLLLAVFAAPLFLLLAAWHSFHQQVQDAAVTAWNAVYGFVKGILTAMGAFFVERWNFFYATVSGALSSMWAEIVSVWNTVNGFLQGVLDAIAGFFVERWNFFYATVSSALQSIWGVIVSVWNGVTGFLSSVWGDITSGVSSAWNTVYAIVSSAISSVLSFIQGVGGSILDAITSPFVQAYNWLTGLAGQFFNIGSAIVNGIIGGIEGAAGSLFSTLGNLASSALDAAKSAIGINSPSRAFAEQVGGPISEGIAMGINASAHHVDTALAGVVKPRSFDLGSTFTSGGGPGGTFGASGMGDGGVTNVVHVHVAGGIYGPGGETALVDTIHQGLLRKQARSPLGLTP